MANTFNKKNNSIIEPRINNEIKGVTEVRLIYKEHKDSVSENDFNKVVPWREAIRLANEKNLDLIEINGKTNPIIVKLDAPNPIPSSSNSNVVERWTKN